MRRAAWQMRVDGRLFGAEPNSGHPAIVEMERQGRLYAVVTQNIDGLHQRAGTDPDMVIEVHGTAHWTRCLECGDRRPMAETLARVRAGEHDPPCLVCGGILKSDTISFGQALVPEVIDRALDGEQAVRPAARRRLDAERVPGGGLRAGRPRGGATVVIVNAGPTEMDHHADHLLRGQIGEILPPSC